LIADKIGIEMTELIILSPYALQSAAWKALLTDQPGIQIAGDVSDISQLALLKAAGPVTILIDASSLQADFVSELKRKIPQAGLLILVQSYEVAEVLPLMKAGATGFLSRDASVGDLALAIIATGRGEIVLPPDIAVQSLIALSRGWTVIEESIVSLSERESDVLRLLAHGFTNKDIAQTLFLSVRTVEAHLRNIFTKLDVSSRTEAALWAVQHGYDTQKIK
jgi:DNA-binding NarL/FixJ family response regulator